MHEVEIFFILLETVTEMTSFARRGVMRARHNADSRLCRYLPLTQSYNTNHNNVFRRVYEICNALVDKKNEIPSGTN